MKRMGVNLPCRTSNPSARAMDESFPDNELMADVQTLEAVWLINP